jgi:TonB family protein
MKRLFITLLLGGFCMLMQAQTEENKVFNVVDEMPKFAGGSYEQTYRRPDGTTWTETKSYPSGNEGLIQYLSSNVKYPVVAEENGVEGRVILTFVVERDGSITNVRVAKSVDPALDKEAVRVVSGMPKWIPGSEKGEKVRVKYTVPVTFRLGPGKGKPLSVNSAVEPKDSTEMPTYPGGGEALKKFLRSNMHYPDYAKPYEAEGVCKMLFVVDIYGNISDVVAKDCKITHINEGAIASMTDDEKAAVKKECARQMAKEGLRVIRKMKRWNPGQKNGKPVRSIHVLDLSFSVN